MWINTVTQQVFKFHHEIREAFPGVSFPSEISDESLDAVGVAPVSVSPVPQFDEATQKPVPLPPVENSGAWSMDYEIVALSSDELAGVAAQAMAQAKIDRAVAVSSIVVTTTSGNEFDGHEDAQNRMARAIAMLNEGETIAWVLADNTIATVTRDELKEALRLSGEAMAQLWIQPYL